MLKAINEFFVNFLQRQGETNKKMKVEDLVALFQNEETQKQLASTITKNLPKREGAVKLKDPNAPKRPKSNYMFFCEKNRNDIKEKINKQDPSLTKKDLLQRVMVDCGAAWQALKNRKVYDALALKDKERYAKENEHYVRPSDEQLAELDQNKRRIKRASKEVKSPRKKRDPNAPKHPKSAYMFFCDGERPNVKNDGFEKGDVFKELGRRWQELSDEQKKPMVKKAEKAKAEYAEAKANYAGEQKEEQGEVKDTEPEPVEEPVKPKSEKKKRPKKQPVPAENEFDSDLE